MVSVVLEFDNDRVADLGVNGWTEHAEMLPLRRHWFQLGERGVGVLAVDRLAVHAANAIVATLHVYVGLVIKWLAGNLVETRGRIVPLYFIRRDEIAARLTWRGLTSANPAEYEHT